MKRVHCSYIVALLVVFLLSAIAAQHAVAQQAGTRSVRVSFALVLGNAEKDGEKAPTIWDGSLSVSQGEIENLRVWKPNPFTKAEDTSWQLATIRTIPQGSAQRRRGYENMPLEDNAVLFEITNAAPGVTVEVKTAQGDFSFKVSEVTFGTEKSFLDGIARARRLPNGDTIVDALTEDDFASAVMGAGGLNVAYTAFTHGEGFEERSSIDDRPESDEGFDFLAKPTGGDQVFLIQRRRGAWSEPVAVTPPNQDVYRTAIAAEGRRALWVFWSAKEDGDWDLFARRRVGDTWEKPRKLSKGIGPDAFPVAATDDSGKAWVAWQGFRDGQADIYAMRLDDDTPRVVSSSPANDWAPAIAASKNGSIAVVWDTYDKGDYDVKARVWNGEDFGDEISVAGSLRAEMRPSAAYDADNQLWVAYENSPEGWGKDWGYVEKTGTRLFAGRRVEVRVWDGMQLREPMASPNDIFKGPDLEGPGGTANVNANLSAPRLAVDGKGRVWLAVRSARLGSRGNTGTAWYTHVAAYAGDSWRNEVYCPNTDGWLEARPAMVPRTQGGVTLAVAADRRAAADTDMPANMVRLAAKECGREPFTEEPANAPVQRVNMDIMLSDVPLATQTAVKAPALRPVAAEPVALPDPEAAQEAAVIARLRDYRTEVAGKEVRIFRGEFHRHTEISSDGGGDGLLLDMWRYALDAADMDWIGNGDHDNGNGREYSWWVTQKTTDLFQMASVFTPMYTYERSNTYPDGHRNVVFAERGVRPLPRYRPGLGKAMDDEPFEADRPNSPDTLMLYDYLKHFDGICASHTSGTDMGTDWRDNDALVEPVVEIYQGDRQNYEMPDAPRSNSEDDSVGGWRPYGFVSLALQKGYRLAFQSSSDHASTHMSYCNVWVEEPTREAVLEGMKRRHVYGSTDNIIGEFRCGEHFMGDEFTLKEAPTFNVHIIGAKPMAKIHIIKEGKYAYTHETDKQDVRFDWTDLDPMPGATSYYYVRGEQCDGELVWLSPMWIKYQP